jgi:hypothetical protein
MEAILLVLVCLAPWAFGAVETEFEFVLHAGVAVLLGLWGVRVLLEWHCRWVKCPVALCLAALLLVGACQLMPLPPRLLGWLSPGTARLYEQLFPTRAEVLPYGETREDVLPSAGSTLSLYPGQTRQELLRLLAVVLLFSVVRHNIASAASLRRLSLVALVNGTLLSWFALLQYFSSGDRNTLYWRFPCGGMVFGPFGCHNHFAFYINLCVGLGIGLLLSSGTGPWAETRADRASNSLLAWNPLGNPKALWISVALALMFTGVACSLSRSGLLALVATLGLFGALGFWRWRRLSQWPMVLLSLALALGLLTWLGSSQVRQRLDTLWEGKAFRENRLPIWAHAWPLVGEFPAWGTGYGTFPYVEPLHRVDEANGNAIAGHAENEYLEAIVEGGAVRLALSLLAIGLVYRLGGRAAARPGNPGRAGLALGTLFAFTTLVIHSMGDFGLHIPAIAFLATVVCAQLCTLGDAEGRTRYTGPAAAAGGRLRTAERPAQSSVFSPRTMWRSSAPAVAAILAVFLGAVLCREGWRSCQVHWLRRAVSRLNPTPGPISEEQMLASLQEAARLDPASAALQVELALLYYYLGP